MAQYNIGDKFECEYIFFEMIEQKPKTSVWKCFNYRNKTILGVVKWYSVWRQYVYCTAPNIVYSEGCLMDIAKFVEKLTDENKRNRGQETRVRPAREN